MSDTVFVRGLRPGVNDDELNEAFGDVGPVKSAFIVVEKDGPNKGKSRGFGFVQYALPEDAATAVDQLRGMEIAGAPVKLALAEKKGYKHGSAGPAGKRSKNKRKRDAGGEVTPQDSGENQSKDGNNEDEAGGEEDPEASSSFFRSLARDAVVTQVESKAERNQTIKDTEELLRDSSVVIFGIRQGMPKKVLKRKAGRCGKVNLIEYPLTSLRLGHGDQSNCALVIYTKKTSAATAGAKLDNKSWSDKDPDSVVRCRRLKMVALSAKNQDRCRLIVRNVPFKTDEAALRACFEPFGPVLEVNLDHKRKGFAFVQFACRLDATKAHAQVNGSKLGGRVIAVDWALRKSQYDKIIQQAEEQEVPAEEDGADSSEAAENGENESSVEDDDKKEEEEESEQEEDEDDEEDGDNSGSEDGESREDDGNVESGESETDEAAKDRGYTVFVRNVLFETTEDELFDAFKAYGAVRYVKIVKGGDGRSRGTAFVNYYKEAGFEAVLAQAATVPQIKPVIHNAKNDPEPEEARGGNGITCGGRPLLVTPAVDRRQAQELVVQNEKTKMKKDRRHLYLAREGFIHPDQDVVVPKSDVAKRERAEREKKTKLKNPVFFVSPTRLSIRNLYRGSSDGAERGVSEPELKKAFRKAAHEGLKARLVADAEGDENLLPKGWPNLAKVGPVEIKSAKIMRESTPLADEEGNEVKTNSRTRHKGRSKGFGFIEFGQHVHALAALRFLNNNPAFAHLAAGGPKALKVKEDDRARLIIEFSIENATKLQERQRKIDKIQKRQEMNRNAQLARDHAVEQAKQKKGCEKVRDDVDAPSQSKVGDGSSERAKNRKKRRAASQQDAQMESQPSAAKKAKNVPKAGTVKAVNKKKRKSPPVASAPVASSSAASKSKDGPRQQKKTKAGDKNNAKAGDKKEAKADEFRKLVDQYKASMFAESSSAKEEAPGKTKSQGKRWFAVS
ncbi:RNA-binding protein 28 (RNA-binding motif protein 28) [Durusdinium trenchii]|uniref:RNA-binding protein 28 (RNA-binding motif protein 28) n=1 Tax=Durusdinium trenchii TaxID=1381693 RepID=A0ABP0HET4_9DINO